MKAVSRQEKPVMLDKQKPLWNSLEVAKLLVTPVVVALLGYFVQTQLAAQARQTQELLAEQARSWQQNQRLFDRRLQIYDNVRVELNRIYCYIEDIGSWKEDNPETVLAAKRHIDGEMHSQRAIWSQETFNAYLAYMNSAFLTYTGVGQDAKIKTGAEEKRVGIANWSSDWEQRLTGKKSVDHKSKYDQLLNLLSKDMSLTANQSLKLDVLKLTP